MTEITIVFLLLSGKKIEKVVRFFYQANCIEFKVRRLTRKIHYRFNAQGVCRRYTSMRNPLQAAKRRSCGDNCMRGKCSAKRDLHILLTTNSISPPSGNRPLCPYHPQLRRFAACSGFRIEVPLRGTRSRKFLPDSNIFFTCNKPAVIIRAEFTMFSSTFSMIFKQGFFCFQTRLLLSVNKASFECKQGLFANGVCRNVPTGAFFSFSSTSNLR